MRIAVVAACLVTVGAMGVLAPHTLTGASTATTVRTTSTTDPFDNPLVAGDKPNPGAFYPRRPGAQWRDVERAMGGRVRFGFSNSVRLAAARRVTLADVPARAVAAPRAADGLLAFEPRLVDDRSHLVEVDLRVRYVVIGRTPASPIACSLTAVSDGAAAVPVRMQRTRFSARSVITAANGKGLAVDGTEAVLLWFPIGARVGLFDLACDVTRLWPSGGLRGVWRIDVA